MSKIQLQDVEVDSDIHFFVLEDTPAYQKKIQSTLNDLGFKGKFTVAPSIAEAKAALAHMTPDFFLLDWNLPDGFGIDLLHFIKATGTLNTKPVLMVTTMDDISNILEAVSAGADGYVVKPFTEEEMVEKIAFAIEKRM